MIQPFEMQSLQKSLLRKRSIFETLVREGWHTMVVLFALLFIKQWLQMMLSLHIYTSPGFIWVHWISQNQIPSWLFFLCASPWPEGSWLLSPHTSEVQERSMQQRWHVHQEENRPQLPVCCFSSVFSAEVAKCLQLLLPLSLSSSPTAFVPGTAMNLPGWGGWRMLSSHSTQLWFLPSPTSPAYLHFSSSTVSHNKVREGNKNIMRYILVNIWVIVV